MNLQSSNNIGYKGKSLSEKVPLLSVKFSGTADDTCLYCICKVESSCSRVGCGMDTGAYGSNQLQRSWVVVTSTLKEKARATEYKIKNI